MRSGDHKKSFSDLATMQWPSGKRVIIVGCGVAGLCCFIELSRQGIVPILLEALNVPGGVWAESSRPLSAYDPLQQNTSASSMVIDDHPPQWPSELTHLDRSGYAQYISTVMSASGALERTFFNCDVQSVVRPSLDRGEYEVLVRDAQGELEIKTLIADVVICASGYTRAPYMPKLPDRSTFSGIVVHSSQFGSLPASSDHTPLIIGLGNTGADLACQIASSRGCVSLSLRNDTWIVPRLVSGRPFDEVVAEAYRNSPDDMSEILYRRCNPSGAVYIGSKNNAQRIDYRRARVLINTEFCALFKQGRFHFFPEVRSLQGLGAEFSDGQRISVDQVVFATGFTAPDLGLKPKTEATPRALHNIFAEPDGSLAFAGCPALLGSMPSIASLQAKVIASVVSRPGRVREEPRVAFERICAVNDVGISLVEANNYSTYLRKILRDWRSTSLE